MASSAAAPPPVALEALQRALGSSISGGTFADTAYHLYSQRRSNRTIDKPRVVYGSSLVLKTVSAHFQTQLDDVTSEKELPAEAAEYDYESDSDLDDSEDEPDMKSFEEELLDAATTPRDLSPTWSDLDSVELQSGTEVVSEPNPVVVPETASAVHCKYHVAIPNVAANTLQALIHFVYTGKIHFSPLKSEGLEVRRVAKESHRKENPHLPPLCSSKSVYRLAKLVGLPSLQQLAQDDIKVRTSSKSIAAEIFSRFSSTHEDILNMQLEILYRNGMPPEIMPQVTKAISGVCEGRKPYCDRVLNALMQKLSTLLHTPNPANEPVPSAMPPCPTDNLVSPIMPSPQPLISPSDTRLASLPASSIPISSVLDANSPQQATAISPENTMHSEELLKAGQCQRSSSETSQAENMTLQEEERCPTDDMREEESQRRCEEEDYEEERRTHEELNSSLNPPKPLFEEPKRQEEDQLEVRYEPEDTGLAQAQPRPTHSTSPGKQRAFEPEPAPVPSCVPVTSADVDTSLAGVLAISPSNSHVYAAPSAPPTDVTVSVLQRQNLAGSAEDATLTDSGQNKEPWCRCPRDGTKFRKWQRCKSCNMLMRKRHREQNTEGHWAKDLEEQ